MRVFTADRAAKERVRLARRRCTRRQLGKTQGRLAERRFAAGEGAGDGTGTFFARRVAYKSRFPELLNTPPMETAAEPRRRTAEEGGRKALFFSRRLPQDARGQSKAGSEAEPMQRDDGIA
ncbi:hypothetical protein MTO96_014973 [Rhipicephalus appendiculatus]